MKKIVLSNKTSIFILDILTLLLTLLKKSLSTLLIKKMHKIEEITLCENNPFGGEECATYKGDNAQKFAEKTYNNMMTRSSMLFIIFIVLIISGHFYHKNYL